MAINLDELKNATNLRGRGGKGATFIAPLDGRAHVSGERTAAFARQDHP